MTEETEAPPAITTVEVQRLLGEIAAKDAAARNAGLKPGDTIYDQEIVPGASISRKKERGMITMNGMPLPDRVPIWYRLTGIQKNVSTTLLGKKLALLASDGGPLFVADPAQVTAPKVEYIDETCQVCLRNSGNQVRKRFIHRWDYVGHMETCHQREWRIMEGESRLTPEAIFKALREMTPLERQALLGGSDGNDTGTPSRGKEAEPAQVQQSEQSGTGSCPKCGKSVEKPGKSFKRSLATHQRFHCSARVLAGVGAE